MITSVGRGPIATGTAHSPVRVSVTRGPAVVVVAAKKMHQATDEGLDCLVWDVTRNVWWQWCLSATIDTLHG